MTLELANRLAELRKQHGYSQEELADKLQVSRQAVSKWERGEASPDTDNLIELAKIYNISLDELVGNTPKDKEEKDDDSDRVYIRDDEGNEVRVTKKGVHITGEDGEVHVDNSGVHIFNEEGEEKREIRRRKKNFLDVLCTVGVTFGTVIAYVLLGSLLGLWGQAWVLFLIIPFAPTIPEAIYHRNMAIFAYPVFITFVYLLLCVWILDFSMWHPLWVLFLTIPLYYSIAGVLKKSK